MYRRDISSGREVGMSKRSQVFVLAVLGLLTEGPLHGYELRKRLNLLLGSLRAFSYGSLYPCLRDLVAGGWIEEDVPTETAETPALTGRRAKIVYVITPAGREHFAALLGDAGPDSWEDDGFGVHFAFFRHADADVRLRILEGRRSRLEERRERVRAAFARTRERLDTYTLELQRHGLESVEREVRWLAELIADERQRGADPPPEPVPAPPA
jgi:DNA-binding PadR family transcriptional regulator